jgi:protein-tyrosine kinase
MEENPDDAMTQKLHSVKHIAERRRTIPETPTPVPVAPDFNRAHPVQVHYKRTASAYNRFIPRNDAVKVHQIEEQCRRFCISLFFKEQAPVRSLGITSAIPGEGKSFISIILGRVLANDSVQPVTLIECDWENPSLHDYFGISNAPGLAEWLRGECAEEDIRHRINDNFSIIRAGDGQQDAVRLLQLLAKRGLRKGLSHTDHLLVVDLPSVTTTSYSVLAASLVESLALVVRAGITPGQLVVDVCAYLKELPVQGIILNQIDYRTGVRH